MKYFSLLKIIALVSIFTNNSDAAKILSIFGYPGPSQYIMASALLKGLAKQGHEVTSISTFPQKQPIKNFRDIAVMENLPVFKDALSETAKRKEKPNLYRDIREFTEKGAKIVTNILENSQVRDLMKNEKFDLLIIEIFITEALLGLGEHFKAPIIGVSTLGTYKTIDFVVGNTSPLSYIPYMSLPFDNRMSLKERLRNVIANIIAELNINYMILPPQEKIYKKHFPSASLTFDEARKNVSLVLLNQHFTLSFPRPYVPNMIEVGGLHIEQQVDPLPEDLQQYLDNATEGAIYFSMGSNIKSKDLSSETLSVFLDTFRELNVKVLWKFEEDNFPNKPSNVLIKSWFPQPSILAHPHVKLFISHGGLLSTIETIYHGKPILGLPVWADQPMNVQKAVHAGYALSLELQDITKESFKSAIQELLTNQSYSETVQKISKRYKDQPQTPLETAIYWIEYVLRHDGAVHMRNAGQELNFWQYHNIDVFVILFSVFLFVILILALVYRLVCKLVSSKKSLKKDKLN